MSRKITDRKAQAAMEFLMTYGWAILVVLIVIGALAYFGVLDPSKLLPEKCVFPTGLHCDDYFVTTTAINLTIQNGIGKDIEILDIRVNETSKALLANCGNFLEDGNLSNGQTGTFNLGCGSSGLRSGSKYKFDVELKYKYIGSTFEHTMEGDMFVRVQ